MFFPHGNFYIQNWNVRMKSSSGGVFTLLAEEILDQGGLVCGAAFDDDFRLSHVVIDSKDKLEPLKNSKYAQCSVDYTYRKIKTALDSGRKVLFTGTPCQVAGIKSYPYSPRKLGALKIVISF